MMCPLTGTGRRGTANWSRAPTTGSSRSQPRWPTPTSIRSRPSSSSRPRAGRSSAYAGLGSYYLPLFFPFFLSLFKPRRRAPACLATTHYLPRTINHPTFWTDIARVLADALCLFWGYYFYYSAMPLHISQKCFRPTSSISPTCCPRSRWSRRPNSSSSPACLRSTPPGSSPSLPPPRTPGLPASESHKLN